MRIVKDIEKKRRCGKCIVAFCDANSRSKAHKYCYKHARQAQRENNPIRYYFDILRQNAKNRGKEFTLTIAQFKEFCARTNYLVLKGRRSNDYHIDRINPHKGYSIDNIQILDAASNIRKMHTDKNLPF